MSPLLDLIIKPVLDIINKLIPDPAAKVAAQIEIMKIQQTSEFKQIDAELEAMRGQVEINKVEAGSTNLFVSGWRPLCGYVCVFAMAANYIIVPLMSWAGGIWGGWPPAPRLELDELVVLLSGMLGLGGLRTTEKIRGVAS